MSPATPADRRLRRLLALVPWVAAHDGPTIGEVCARFGCTAEELVADLSLLFLCGVHPFTPDTLMETSVEGGRVWIRFADWFSHPLRLTPAEGLALVAAGSALLAVPGVDHDGPLARALAKVAAALGVDPDDAVGVELEPAPAEVLAPLEEASGDHRPVEIDYYSFGRDAWGRRVVDPHQVFNDAGRWYLAAWCHSAGADRTFRLDRIRSVTPAEGSFAPRPARPAPAVFSPGPDDPVVVLDLARRAWWVAEEYPNEGVEDRPDGRRRVRLRATQRAWLERLLLRLGPDAEVVEGDRDVVRAAAARVLHRYRGRVPGP